MIIVITGMVGIDKKSYLEDVCELGRQKGTDIDLCNVGDMMYAEAPDIPAGKILDISMKRLHSLRRSVFKDIIAKARKVSNLIVNTHATFRWQHGLFPAVDFDQMRKLNADMYINLIDGVTALHARLRLEHTHEHTLKDLIIWREEEIIGTEMLCRGIDEKIPFYCMARGAEKQTIEAFYKLIFNRDSEKAYIGFPMTHVTGLSDVTEQINDFRAMMHELFICFDPADLEESDLPALAREARQDGLHYVELLAAGQKIRLDVEQISQIEKDINSQIYARDFMLIDQADMIVSFVPALSDGRAAISSGVERELQHAHEAAKQVYVIWAAKQRPSVFVTQTATRVFYNLKEAENFFRTKENKK